MKEKSDVWNETTFYWMGYIVLQVYYVFFLILAWSYTRLSSVLVEDYSFLASVMGIIKKTSFWVKGGKVLYNWCTPWTPECLYLFHGHRVLQHAFVLSHLPRCYITLQCVGSTCQGCTCKRPKTIQLPFRHIRLQHLSGGYFCNQVHLPKSSQLILHGVSCYFVLYFARAWSDFFLD